MNAKELIEAATYCNEVFGQVEDMSIDAGAVMPLVRHTLTTVRPDDDEPVTRERLEADGWELRSHVIKSVGYEMQLRDFTLLVELTDGVADLWADGLSVNPLKSIGHLRRIVAALGER